MSTDKLSLCEIDERDEYYAAAPAYVPSAARDRTWSAARPYPFETCRWERPGEGERGDGEWVSVALNLTSTTVAVMVTASDGRRAALDSLEAAFAAARAWMAD